MPLQQKHGKGGDPTKVHEDVAECIKHINILENMLLQINFQGLQINGKLNISGDHCTLSSQ